MHELSRLPSVRSESIPRRRRRRRRRRPTRVPNMSLRERGASGSFDALVAAVSVIVESPCSCPTSNKSTALRGTPRRDSEENWSRRDIVRPGTLHATSDLFSLSLSLALSRRSVLARREDPREMEEGPIFSGELVYSLLEGREGEAACGDRETRARAIFISRRAKWKRHRAFRAPRVSQLRGSCWLRRRGEGKQFSLSLSLEKNFEFHPPSRDERRRRRRGERKGEKFFELDDYSN